MSERIVCNDNGGELREEIVRCRDCIHFAEGHQSGVVWGGRTPDWCVLRDYPTKGDGFCHRGIRRDA